MMERDSVSSYTTASWFPRVAKGLLAVIVLAVMFIWFYEGVPSSARSSRRPEVPVEEQRASKPALRAGFRSSASARYPKGTLRPCRDEVRIVAQSDQRDVHVLLIFGWDGAEDYYRVLKKGQRFDYANKPRTPPHYVYSPTGLR